MSAGGTLMLLSSSVGRQGRAGWGPYAISKHGLEGLSDTLAEEYPMLRVFSVNPGGTATDMRQEAYPDEDPQTLPTAHEVAQVILSYVDDKTLPSGAKLNCRDQLG
jgi:NAD(P)-dependent dehydrogenase (short-subunit alcohol dehydrogenase family)